MFIFEEKTYYLPDDTPYMCSDRILQKLFNGFTFFSLPSFPVQFVQAIMDEEYVTCEKLNVKRERERERKMCSHTHIPIKT